MRRKWMKCMIGICVIGMMSLGVYGCGAGEDEGTSAQTVQEEPEEEAQAEDGLSEEPKAPAEDNEMSTGAEASADDDASGDKQEPESSSGQETSLVGDIKEIGDGEFRIVEAFVGEMENGGQTLTTIASGVEAKDLKTVVYDEDTTFTFKTIWDGGARYEEREGTADDLAEELLVDMKGSYEEDVFHATEIVISKVVL